VVGNFGNSGISRDQFSFLFRASCGPLWGHSLEIGFRLLFSRGPEILGVLRPGVLKFRGRGEENKFFWDTTVVFFTGNILSPCEREDKEKNVGW